MLAAFRHRAGEMRGPKLDKLRGGKVVVLDQLQAGAALLAESRHRVRDDERGRETVFPEHGRRRGDDALEQTGDMLITIDPQTRERGGGEKICHRGPPLKDTNSPEPGAFKLRMTGSTTMIAESAGLRSGTASGLRLLRS